MNHTLLIICGTVILTALILSALLIIRLNPEGKRRTSIGTGAVKSAFATTKRFKIGKVFGQIVGWIVAITFVCFLWNTHDEWWIWSVARTTSHVTVDQQPQVITVVREINGDGFCEPVEVKGRPVSSSTGVGGGLVVRVNGTKVINIPEGQIPGIGPNVNTLEFKTEDRKKSGFIYVYITP